MTCQCVCSFSAQQAARNRTKPPSCALPQNALVAIKSNQKFIKLGSHLVSFVACQFQGRLSQAISRQTHFFTSILSSSSFKRFWKESSCHVLVRIGQCSSKKLVNYSCLRSNNKVLFTHLCMTHRHTRTQIIIVFIMAKTKGGPDPHRPSQHHPSLLPIAWPLMFRALGFP